MNCKNCGKILSQEEKFCTKCGTKVENRVNAFEASNVNQNQEIGQNLNQTVFNNQGQANNRNI